MAKSLTELDKRLLQDLATCVFQTSWDWQADKRYALLLGDDDAAKIIDEACNSWVPISFRYATVQATGIKPKRLARLRKLMKLGLVQAWWTGTAEGGWNQLGVRRLRSYALTNKGRAVAHQITARERILEKPLKWIIAKDGECKTCLALEGKGEMTWEK